MIKSQYYIKIILPWNQELFIIYIKNFTIWELYDILNKKFGWKGLVLLTKQVRSFDTKEVGRKIRDLRKARNMKQDDLGVVLGGLSRGQVSNLETGKRNISLHQAKILADYFGVSLETLGLVTNDIEITDLLTRAKLIFESQSVPIDEKQELYESVMKLYLEAKEQIKK